MRKLIALSVLIGLLALLAVIPVAAGGHAGDPPGLARTIAAQEAHTDALLANENVVGTAVGLGVDGEAVVKIYTVRGGVKGLPRRLNGVPVVVQVTGEFVAQPKPPWANGGNKRPSVDITSHSDGDVVAAGSVLTTLIATANDPEDEDVSDSILWESSIDGILNEDEVPSASITVDLTDDVIHTITATAVDSEGLTGSDSVEVTVGVVVVPVDPKGEFRDPMFIGISIGSDRLISMKGSLFSTVGTSGLFLVDDQVATDPNNDKVYILSNNHVLAQEGAGVVGVAGDWILQPGRVDLSPGCGTLGERTAATIGTLAAFADIEFSRRASNIVDAAVALVPGAMGVDFLNETPAGGYGAVGSSTTTVSLGDVVHKNGRTTGPTSGTVTGTNASLIIRYDSGRARFDSQIVITGTGGSFSASGDSGALVVDAGNNPVGLHFAGSSSTSIANPIGDVITAMETELGVTLEIG